MSRWRIERHYGFGAAQIPIRPEPHHAMPVGLAEGAASFVEELTQGGVLSTIHRAAGEASTVLLAVLILGAVSLTLLRDHSDVSPIEIALFETARPQATPIIEAPIPLPVPVPIVPILAEVPKPTPKSEPKKPVMPTPRPQQHIAATPAPRPLPTPTPTPTPVRPQPKSRPRVAMDAIHPERPAPISRADRIARAPVDTQSRDRHAPRLAAPAAPAFDLPKESTSRTAFRAARMKAAPSDPMRGRRVIAPTSTPSPSRIASAASPPPNPSARTSRKVPGTPGRRTSRPSALVARADVRSKPALAPAASRADRRARQAPPELEGADSVRLAGVPLGELAACLSDRDEDRLKQAVVAAVTTQKECVSNRGVYRFVETKNLNAFLMWIERAPGRSGADRCTELGYALECLKGAPQRASR
jgi:hypothetical protein